MDDEEDWGDFGGFQSAHEDSLQTEAQTLDWAAAFPVPVAVPSNAPAVIPTAVSLESVTTIPTSIPVAFPATSPTAIAITEITDVNSQASQNEFTALSNSPEQKDFPESCNAKEEKEMSIIPVNESPVSTQQAPIAAVNREERQDVSEKIANTDAVVAKLNLDIDNLNKEKQSIESKLTDTLLLLEEQRRLNSEMQAKTQDEIEKIDQNSKAALKLILEEHKRQTKEAILETQQRCLLEAKGTLDSQAEEREKHFEAQKEEYEKRFEDEKAKFQGDVKKVLDVIKEEFKQEQNTQLADAQKIWEENSAEKLENMKTDMLEQFKKAIEAEKENHQKMLSEVKEQFEMSLEKEQQAFETRVKESLEKQRDDIWESVKSMLENQRSQWKSLSEEIREETRENTVDFMKQKEQIDSLTRRRHLSGMEILLNSVQNQLKELLSSEQSGDDDASTQLDMNDKS